MTPAVQGAADGPVVQSVGIAFRVLYAAVAVLAAAWAASNWMQVPADMAAVVLRFGRITGVQAAGLAMAWPRPAGTVAAVPGPSRLLTVATATTARPGGLQDIYTAANGSTLADGAGSYLTGDGGVVLLRATVAYQVSDPAAFFLAQAHAEAALRRVFSAAAVQVAAGRTLDDVLVARPDALGGAAPQAATNEASLAATLAAGAEARRQALRGDLVAAMNARLAALAQAGAPLGVTVARVDVDAALPPAARIAFDGVLVAGQLAEQGVATARTEATRITQATDREADHLLTAARAAAAEQVADARARTAPVLALEAGLLPDTRQAVLDQVFRDGMAALLPKVGRLTAVDPDGARVILPASPGGGSP